MNESSRQERIIRTSVVGILVNLLIAAVKIMIGTLASSIAIVSEGINNATDAGSSFLTYIGTKLSGKHPDEKHPFGYGWIKLHRYRFRKDPIEWLIKSEKYRKDPWDRRQPLR